jgi:hypothetical protein
MLTSTVFGFLVLVLEYVTVGDSELKKFPNQNRPRKDEGVLEETEVSPRDLRDIKSENIRTFSLVV